MHQRMVEVAYDDYGPSRLTVMNVVSLEEATEVVVEVLLAHQEVAEEPHLPFHLAVVHEPPLQLLLPQMPTLATEYMMDIHLLLDHSEAPRASHEG